MLRFVYLAQGKLFYQDNDHPAQEIISQYGQEVIDRIARMHQNHGWKGQKRDEGFLNGELLWGRRLSDPTTSNVEITAVTRGENSDELIYALDTDRVGGVFRYHLGQRQENRLFHEADFYACDLCHYPKEGLLAYSLQFANCTANIGVMGIDKCHLRPLTEGDTLDQAPSWVPGRRALVFQSAGVGRDAQGNLVGYSPFSIEEVDLEKRQLVTLQESQEYDFLAPQKTAEGDLLFIRRPYEPLMGRTHPGRLFADILFFPFRLLSAFFHFLNFFSLTYSGKPLTTADGPKKFGMDMRSLILAGKRINAEKALRHTKKGKDLPALVPNSWELIRHRKDGTETILAQGVLAYDLAGDTIIYTNGTAVFALPPEGRPQRLCQHKLIEKLIAIY